MNIIYASDDNYADIAGVSILSLFENNKEVDNMSIFMLDNGISEENKTKLSNIADTYSRKIIFVDMPDMKKIVGINFDTSRWPLASFARLFITSVLPNDMERIIYLDCDTMIRGTLLPLWNENLDGNILGGVPGSLGKLYKKQIFLKNSDIYINSGILLINFKLWRELKVETKCINFIKLFDGKFIYPDQDVINGVLSHYIKLLSPKYNYTCIINNYIRTIHFYNECDINEAKENPTIYHFISPDKRPWIKGNVHEYQNEYMKYRNMTPWAHSPLKEQTHKIKNKNALKVHIHRVLKHKVLKLLLTPIYNKYRSLRVFFNYQKRIAYAKRRLKESTVRLEDCYINYPNHISSPPPILIFDYQIFNTLRKVAA